MPYTHQMQMASTAMKINSAGFCVADIRGNVGKTRYLSTRLNMLVNLCSDVILGLYFQSQHQQLVIKFHGESPDLVVTQQDSHCLLRIAKTSKVSLFSNLSADAKPIATPSRRYNQEDWVFIQENVDKLLIVMRP